MRQSGQRGFSLIELLIVVAIILVLAAIAIPSLLRSRINANEASAVASIRTIHTAQVTYQVAYPATGYADALTKLAMPASGGTVDSSAAGLLDWVLGCATQPCAKSGYMFQVTNAVGTPVTAYEIDAFPGVVGQTGNRGFCSDSLSKVMFDPAGGTNCSQLIQ